MEDTAAWRAKANEARAHAAGTTDPQIRSAMLKIAESYEHLAAIAERTAADATLSLYN
jgi:heme-degrading monooxygenase HmoA